MLELLWHESPFNDLSRSEAVLELLRFATTNLRDTVDSSSTPPMTEAERVGWLFGLDDSHASLNRHILWNKATAGINFAYGARGSSKAAQDKAEYRWRIVRFGLLAQALIDLRAGGYRLQIPVSKTLPPALPRRNSDFIGRNGELALLSSYSTDPDSVLHITGGAGVGKTALAIEWAHQVASEYPDGKVLVDLRGFSSLPPLDNRSAMVEIAAALGAAEHELPSDDLGLELAYQGLFTTRRVLLILDNVASAEQVSKLIPTVSSIRTVLTSRTGLSSLSLRYGLRVVGLDVLQIDDGIALLKKILGPSRVDSQRDSAEVLIENCGRLPLAVVIAAANLRRRPTKTLRTAAKEIDFPNVGKLNLLNSEFSLRRALDWSLGTLKKETRSFFLELVALPQNDFDYFIVGDLDPASGARHLDILLDLKLVEEQSEGRFYLRDLVKSYGIVTLIDEPGSTVAWLEGRLLRAALRMIGNALQIMSSSSWIDTAPGPNKQRELIEYFADSRVHLEFSIQWSVSHGKFALALLGLGAKWSLQINTGDWEGAINTLSAGAAHLEQAEIDARSLMEAKSTEFPEAGAVAALALAMGVKWPVLKQVTLTKVGQYFVSSIGRMDVASALIERTAEVLQDPNIELALPVEFLYEEIQGSEQAVLDWSAELERDFRAHLAPASSVENLDALDPSLISRLIVLAVAQLNRGDHQSSMENFKTAEALLWVSSNGGERDNTAMQMISILMGSTKVADFVARIIAEQSESLAGDNRKTLERTARDIRLKVHLACCTALLLCEEAHLSAAISGDLLHMMQNSFTYAKGSTRDS
jgi:hypothetical protein